MTEFEYNSSVNESTSNSAIEIVMDLQPRKVIDLEPLPHGGHHGAEDEGFFGHI